VAYVFVYTVLFVVAFSSVANFGLLARQRLQLTPLFLVLLSQPIVKARDRGKKSTQLRTRDMSRVTSVGVPTRRSGGSI
jgi:hypothetical protein